MTKAVELAQVASTGVSEAFKNRIINGAMTIDQRNSGASVTPTDGQYTLDRWRSQVSQTNRLTIQQDAGAVTPPVGFTDYLGITSTASTSLGASDYFGVFQFIEGFNIADLGWGTANAKTVTLSFWVRSSLTGTFSGVIKNGSNSRGYPFVYTITSANTWEYETITIPGDTTGTWNTTNGAGISVLFSVGAGTSGSATAGAWTAGNINGATGAVSVVGTNGATFYITGVQFEVGTTATSFDYRTYGTELALCQRYYEIINFPSNIINVFLSSMLLSQDNSHHTWYFHVPKRATPTFALMTGASWQNRTPNEIRTAVDGITFYSNSSYFFVSSSTASSPAASASSEL